MNFLRKLLLKPFFIRLLHWEYWSFSTVYTPIYPIWVFLGLRIRSMFFFNAANPGFENGGFLMESKKKIYDGMPSSFYPQTFFVPADSAREDIEKLYTESPIEFPLIIKPDIGARGKGVKTIHNLDELVGTIENLPVPMLVQAMIPYTNEVGIFYYRYPDRARGCISGIVMKEFLSVTGDGKSSIRELVMKQKRAILQLDFLEPFLEKENEMILPAGEKKVLVPFGNHARGALFLDGIELKDEALERAIDDICQQIPGFFYGRLDIMYRSLEELRDGKHFALVEVNGSGSEPTHIYDPKHSVFFAWKEIVRHWIIQWRISRLNHRRGVAYMSFREGMALIRESRMYEKKFNELKIE